MSNSPDSSPDWLRSFQAPSKAVLTLSSGSESSPDGSPKESEIGISTGDTPMEETSSILQKDDDLDVEKSPLHKASNQTPSKRKPKADVRTNRKRKRDAKCEDEEDSSDDKIVRRNSSYKPIQSILKEGSHTVLTLSSDSESNAGENKESFSMFKKENGKDFDGEPSFNKSTKKRSPKQGSIKEDTPTKKESGPIKSGNAGDVGVDEDEGCKKPVAPHVSSSSLPLMLSEKVQRTKALVECDGESIDLSGDVGAVGRIMLSANSTRNQEMLLDLKGTIYKTSIVPSRTFCVVSFGQSEAKIEAIMNDFIQLKAVSNVYEAETMVEGTLEGFSFDSEDEGDKLPNTVTHQPEPTDDAEEKGKGKRKVEKTSGTAKRKGKAAGGKPTKKVKKKPQVSRKTKAKK